jgi:hypothetical protein
MPAVTHLHLPVVGNGNSVPVPSLVWNGGERGIGSAVLAINICREALVRRHFKKHRAQDLPLDMPDTSFNAQLRLWHFPITLGTCT